MSLVRLGRGIRSRIGAGNNCPLAALPSLDPHDDLQRAEGLYTSHIAECVDRRAGEWRTGFVTNSRSVVVSGGGSGMGRAIAEAFAAAGDSVLILGRRADKLAEVASSTGGRHVACDLSNAEDGAAAAESFDKIEVLVNCAGGRSCRKGRDLGTIRQRWTDDFETNVLTVVLLTEAAFPHFAPGARLITIGSIAAWRGNDSYGAVKAALHGWNHGVVPRMAAIGGTSNIVVPGFVSGTEFFGIELTEADLARRAGESLLGRVGQVDDIVGMVTYLASPAAGFVTGQILGVNGGAVLGR